MAVLPHLVIHSNSPPPAFVKHCQRHIFFDRQRHDLIKKILRGVINRRRRAQISAGNSKMRTDPPPFLQILPTFDAPPHQNRLSQNFLQVVETSFNKLGEQKEPGEIWLKKRILVISQNTSRAKSFLPFLLSLISFVR